jgi:hypothetical protein
MAQSPDISNGLSFGSHAEEAVLQFGHGLSTGEWNGYDTVEHLQLLLDDLHVAAARAGDDYLHLRENVMAGAPLELFAPAARTAVRAVVWHGFNAAAYSRDTGSTLRGLINVAASGTTPIRRVERIARRTLLGDMRDLRARRSGEGLSRVDFAREHNYHQAVLENALLATPYTQFRERLRVAGEQLGNLSLTSR